MVDVVVVVVRQVFPALFGVFVFVVAIEELWLNVAKAGFVGVTLEGLGAGLWLQVVMDGGEEGGKDVFLDDNAFLGAGVVYEDDGVVGVSGDPGDEVM